MQVAPLEAPIPAVTPSEGTSGSPAADEPLERKPIVITTKALVSIIALALLQTVIIVLSFVGYWHCDITASDLPTNSSKEQEVVAYTCSLLPKSKIGGYLLLFAHALLIVPQYSVVVVILKKIPDTAAFLIFGSSVSYYMAAMLFFYIFIGVSDMKIEDHFKAVIIGFDVAIASLLLCIFFSFFHNYSFCEAISENICKPHEEQ